MHDKHQTSRQHHPDVVGGEKCIAGRSLKGGEVGEFRSLFRRLGDGFGGRHDRVSGGNSVLTVGGQREREHREDPGQFQQPEDGLGP